MPRQSSLLASLAPNPGNKRDQFAFLPASDGAGLNISSELNKEHAGPARAIYREKFSCYARLKLFHLTFIGCLVWVSTHGDLVYVAVFKLLANQVHRTHL